VDFDSLPLVLGHFSFPNHLFCILSRLSETPASFLTKKKEAESKPAGREKQGCKERERSARQKQKEVWMSPVQR